MNEDARQAFTAWKQAEEQARNAEARLAQAWSTYFSRHESPPPRELIGEVARLRSAANERLEIALRALDAARAHTERPSA